MLKSYTQKKKVQIAYSDKKIRYVWFSDAQETKIIEFFVIIDAFELFYLCLGHYHRIFILQTN